MLHFIQLDSEISKGGSTLWDPTLRLIKLYESPNADLPFGSTQESGKVRKSHVRTHHVSPCHYGVCYFCCLKGLSQSVQVPLGCLKRIYGVNNSEIASPVSHTCVLPAAAGSLSPAWAMDDGAGTDPSPLPKDSMRLYKWNIHRPQSYETTTPWKAHVCVYIYYTTTRSLWVCHKVPPVLFSSRQRGRPLHGSAKQSRQESLNGSHFPKSATGWEWSSAPSLPEFFAPSSREHHMFLSPQ